MSNNLVNRAVAYARYSSDNQRSESIDAQLHDIREWAIDNGYQIVRVYTDEAETGTSDDRDGFLQMIADSRNGDYEAVLVHKSDRFARNKWDAAIYKKALRDNNIKLIYVMQPMLSEDTPEAMLMEGIFESLDYYYSLNLGREVMKGMNENARHCKHNGGRPALGFDVDKNSNTYIINEHEAKAVRLIFEMYAEGMSYDKIVKSLNTQGFKTKTGGLFAKNSISDILRNEKYLGIYIYNRTLRKVNGKRNHRKNKPDDQVVKIPGGMPQIIEQELWDKVQTIIQNRGRKPGERSRNRSTREYLLSGKIECGLCGFKMIGKSGTNGKKVRYDYYLCNNRDRKHACKAKMVRKDLLELQVIEQLEEQLLNPKLFPVLVDKIYKHLNEIGNESNKELIYLKAELSKIQLKINNMLNLIEEGAGSIEMTRRLAHRESEKAILASRIHEIERKAKANIIPKEIILAYLQERYRSLKSLDILTAKSLINEFVEKVIVYEDEFEVIFKISLLTDGGGGGSRTPVRKKDQQSLSERSLCFEFRPPAARRQATFALSPISFPVKPLEKEG